MARLICDCQNREKHNSEQTSASSITIPESNVPCLTNDSSVDEVAAAAAANTTRIQLMASAKQKYILSQLSSSDPTDAGYAAPAATIDSESLVARLAAKFNAAVLTSIDEANVATTISSDEILPIPLPTSMSYPAEKTITLQNSSSVQKTIKFFEKDARTSSNKAHDVVKTMEEQHSDEEVIIDVRCSHKNGESEAQNREPHGQLSKNNEPKLESNVKPSVQPKPTILLQKTTTAIQKSVLLEHERNTKDIYYAPKLYAKSNRTQILKHKRLSIAKDFSLESVLNSEVNSTDKEQDGEGKVSTFSYETKMVNRSFLHKHQEKCVENNKSVVVEQESLDRDSNWREEQQIVASLSCKNSSSSSSSSSNNNLRNSSSLHDSLMRTINESQHLHDLGDYEELYREKSMAFSPGLDENTKGHYYQYLDKEELSNVYTDIIYTQLTNKDEIECYETISSESRPNSPTALKDDFVFPSDHNGYSDSQSSIEQTNSLYDSKPICELSSTRSSVFNLSNEYSHSKCEASRISITGITDDEDDADYYDSDVNENHAFTLRKRNKLFKKRKPRFTLHKKDPQPIITQQHESSIENLCDDFDNSSSEFETYDLNKKNTTVHGPKKHSISSVTQSQNIYGLVQKARKTVRKSWSSLNQIRKMHVGNITTKTQDVANSRSKSVSVSEIDCKNRHAMGSTGSLRWTSFKSKLKPKHSTIASSTSIFYLPPEDLLFKKRSPCHNVTKKQNDLSKSDFGRRTMCTELKPTRPTSPPPPPPVDRLKINENGISTLSIYSDLSTKSSNSGSEVTSEPNSSRSSDLQLRFADEPLYQFYAESIAKLSMTDSLSALTDSGGYEEITSTSRPSAMELITPSPNGHGQHRSLWCEVPEVKNSGILDTLSPSKKKLQETIFEIITSEASYYKSLSILDKIFVSSPLLRDETILSKTHWKILFGNVSAVKRCSEKLLAGLEKCWQGSILLTGLCDVIYLHATENFRVYIKYCSNQIYISRTLKELRELNYRFTEIISQLEADPACQSLNLASFLMLPMQRITRMPLLIDAVVSKMDHILDSEEYKTYQISLATLNKIVRDCNDSACKLERYEEMLLLSQQLEFSKKDVKLYTIASSSRWLIRCGPMEHISPPDVKLTLTKKLTKHTAKLYFFLFNDIFIVTKKKSDAPTYVVFDYCPRNVVQMSLPDDNCMNLPSSINTSNFRYLLLLTLLENHERKTVEMILNCDSDSTRQRWLEATSSHLTTDNPDERLYEEWDCPQVSAIHAYTAIQPDELSLHIGDVVKVLKKTTDGWFHGERIRDGMIGWFPGNYTIEIASQHTRAKNLKLRHRLLTLSASYLQNQHQKKT